MGSEVAAKGPDWLLNYFACKSSETRSYNDCVYMQMHKTFKEPLYYMSKPLDFI